MVFADWTHSGNGTAALDGSIKYAGNSSCRLALSGINGTVYLTHDTFLEPHAQVILWVRKYEYGSTWKSYPRIILSGYGNMDMSAYTTNETWAKFKVTFWYDTSANTKWGRLEKFVDSSWAQQGNDTDFGSGSPAASTLALIVYASASAYNKYAWFDEVEVYS